MERHVVVVGLMGSGKTTVGRALAELLDRPHRDSDADIEAAHGRTAREIAASEGVDALHALELEHLVGALEAPEPSVISAAASVIEEPAGRAALARDDVTTVWLRIDPATAIRRAAGGDHRPSTEPLADQAARRDPWFRAVADVEVDAGLSVDEIVRQVEPALAGPDR